MAKLWSGWIRVVLAALSGLLAGYAALAVAELVSAAVRPQASPVVAVGGAAIDRTPPAVKDWAIRHFGTNDKLVLQLGILAVLALFAMLLGVVALRYRRIGAAGVLLFGGVGALAATSRPDSTGAADAVPSIVGTVVAAGLLFWLIGRLQTHRSPHRAVGEPDAADRRVPSAGSNATVDEPEPPRLVARRGRGGTAVGSSWPRPLPRPHPRGRAGSACR